MEYVLPVMYYEQDAKQVVVSVNTEVDRTLYAPAQLHNCEAVPQFAPIRLYHEHEKQVQNAAPSTAPQLATNNRCGIMGPIY